MAKGTQKELEQQTFQTLTHFEKEREPVELQWQDHADLVMPRRALMDFEKSRRGERRTLRRFDSTATGAAVLLADGLQGYMTSQSIMWFKMMLVLLGRQKDLMNNSDVKRWLQDLEEVYRYLYQESNFYDAVGEVYLDGIVPGTATLYVGENRKKDGLRFSCRHPKETYISENEDEVVDTHFRKFYRRNMDIARIFGADPCGKEFMQKAKDNPHDESLLLHTVFPREHRDYTKSDKTNKAYASHYFLLDGQRLLSTGGYNSNPHITWRFYKNSDEIYARSPTWDAASDISRINAMSKGELDQVHLAGHPPIMYPNELEDLQLDPEGRNPYIDPARRIYAVDMAGNYQITRDKIEDIRKAIREHFRVDFFLMLTEMSAKNMTATQVIEMQGEKAAILGTIISRISSELLDPIFDRVYDIILENGWLPPMPAILQDFGGTKIRPQYTGPLAQAQRRYHATQGTLNAINQIAPYVQLWPKMLYAVNDVELAIHLLSEGGAPEKVLNDRETIMAMIQRAEQMQAQEQQLLKLQSLSESYNKGNATPEGGSMAAKISEAAEEELVA